MAENRVKRRQRPVIRLFVSSTFDDLIHERNALQSKVWPTLERLCQKEGFTFQAIDLRWGVSGEAWLDHRTMQICFEELRRSQDISSGPNFLILLGNRYGWRPLPEEISIHEFEQLEQAVPKLAEGKQTFAKAALATWYQLDTNNIPSVYILRSRLPALNDGKNYGQVAGEDSQDWVDVQTALWSIINMAFPADQLRDRFQHSIRPDGPLPSVVRFQTSATEQEIWRGALCVPQAEQHVLAFVREIDNLDQADGHPRFNRFVDMCSDGQIDNGPQQTLKELKAELCRRLGENRVITIGSTPNVKPQEGQNAAEPIRFIDQDVNGRPLTNRRGHLTVDITTAHLDAFCARVSSELELLIQRRIAGYWEGERAASDLHMNPRQQRMQRVERTLEIEANEHEYFAEERGPEQSFVGRQSQRQAIQDYLRNDSASPLVIRGASGCGKTALLARAAQDAGGKCKALDKPLPVVRFIGATPHSSDVRSLLSSLCQELRRRHPRASELSSDVGELTKELQEHFTAATIESPTIMFLDALDQLSDADDGRRLFWIPVDPLPSHVKLIVSCLSDRDERDPDSQPYLELQRRRLPAEAFIDLANLSETDAKSLIFEHWLPQTQREVNNRQRARIDQLLQSDECRLPLYLRVLFDEARLWRSYDAVPAVDGTLMGLLAGVFGRLGDPERHGRTVKAASIAITAARRGLTEDEIVRVLKADPDYFEWFLLRAQHTLPEEADRIPIVIWSRLRLDMAQYLAEYAVPGGNVIHFCHRQFSECVRAQFLALPSECRKRHEQLATFFDKQAYWFASSQEQHVKQTHRAEMLRPANERKADEVLWQRLQANQWDDCTRLLETLDYLEAKSQAGLLFDLATEFRDTIDAHVGRLDRSHLRLLDEALQRELHFIYRHRADYPQALFQCLWNVCWWYDCPDAANHYVQPSGGWREAPPWMRPGNKLFLLMERWRDEKESQEPGFRWLRSQRPPALQLGIGQIVVLQEHKDLVKSVAISLVGGYIVSGSWDKTIRVWDAKTGRERAVLGGHSKGVNSVAISPNGRWIVSGSADKTIRMWDASSGAEQAVLCGHEEGINSVAISPDGQWIVSGSRDKTVRVWDAKTGMQRVVLSGHTHMIEGVAISRYGQWIVSGSYDTTVRVWDAKTGSERAVLSGHLKGVSSVAISPDDQWIVSGSRDNTVRVWDANTGAEQTVLCGHEEAVSSVAISPDGQWIVSGSEDKTVRVWNAETGAEQAVLHGHQDYVCGVTFSPDGQRILSGSSDKTVRIWSAKSGAEQAVLRGHQEWINGILLSFDGRRVVSFSLDKTLRVWDANTGEERAVLCGHEQSVSCGAMCPDGLRIVSGSSDRNVRVWTIETGLERAVLRGHGDWVHAVAMSADSPWIVSVSGDTTVRLWDMNTGAEHAVLLGHDSDVRCVAISPDGRWIVSGSDDKTVRVWNAKTGAEHVVCCGHREPVWCVAFSPDGRHVVSGSGTKSDSSQDTTVRIWDADTGVEQFILRGHERTVTRVAYSRDGRQIISESESRHSEHKTVRIWDAAKGACLKTIRGNGDVAEIAREHIAHALNRGQETVIEATGTGLPLAWFPLGLWDITTCSSGSRWVGGDSSYLCFLELVGTTVGNGKPPSATINQLT